MRRFFPPKNPKRPKACYFIVELLVQEVPAEILVALSDATIIGPADRRLAAKLLLDCLTREQDVASCLDFLKREELDEVAEAMTDLAADIGLT